MARKQKRTITTAERTPVEPDDLLATVGGGDDPLLSLGGECPAEMPEPTTGRRRAIDVRTGLPVGWKPAPEPPSGPEPKVDLYHQDCITGMAEHVPDDSVDVVVTSIPFEELFTYSGKMEDVGNNGSTTDMMNGRFHLNLKFVITQLLRVLKPSCNACIHIQQLLAYKVQHGYMGRRDFRGMVIDAFTDVGFEFTGEFVIAKCPQRMAQTLNLHSLQFKTGFERNSCLLKPAVNDYVLIFSKPGEHPNPPTCLWGQDRNPSGWVTPDEWVKWAWGVWDDIDEIEVLDGTRNHKDEKHERHVCPFALEVPRRIIQMYSAPLSIDPTSTVLDPFMGVGSTAYVSVGGRVPVHKKNIAQGEYVRRIAGQRNVIGFELKDSYYRASRDYVERALAARHEAEQRADEGTLVAGL
jgi:DNA modification methylase